MVGYEGCVALVRKRVGWIGIICGEPWPKHEDFDYLSSLSDGSQFTQIARLEAFTTTRSDKHHSRLGLASPMLPNQARSCQAMKTLIIRIFALSYRVDGDVQAAIRLCQWIR